MQQPWQPPVHQPGIVPLRPLTLGDMFGGAMKNIRLNGMATVGMATVVTLAFMLIPILATVALGTTDVFASMDVSTGGGATAGNSTLGDSGLMLSSVVSTVFSMLATIVVTGLVVRTVDEAVVGRRISAGEAWRRSKGRLLPLLGLTLLTGLVGVLVIGLPIVLGVVIGTVVDVALGVVVGVFGTLLGVVAAVFLYTRYVLLAAPVLVLEERGVLASLARAGQLSRGNFWRLLGIYLLATLVTALVGQVIAMPFAVLGVVGLVVLPDSWGFVAMMLSSHLATVLTGGLLGPFTGGVMALQYLDQRFRKEGLDIELLHRTSGRQPS